MNTGIGVCMLIKMSRCFYVGAMPSLTKPSLEQDAHA